MIKQALWIWGCSPVQWLKHSIYASIHLGTHQPFVWLQSLEVTLTLWLLPPEMYSGDHLLLMTNMLFCFCNLLMQTFKTTWLPLLAEQNRSWLPCADPQGPLVILPLKILPSGAEEMALWLSALVSLEGFESQHSHQAANNHLKLQCQKKQCPLLAFMSTAHK